MSKFYLHVTYRKTTVDLLYNKQLKRDNKCVKRTASRDSTCTCVKTDWKRIFYFTIFDLENFISYCPNKKEHWISVLTTGKNSSNEKKKIKNEASQVYQGLWNTEITQSIVAFLGNHGYIQSKVVLYQYQFVRKYDCI